MRGAGAVHVLRIARSACGQGLRCVTNLRRKLNSWNTRAHDVLYKAAEHCEAQAPGLLMMDGLRPGRVGLCPLP